MMRWLLAPPDSIRWPEIQRVRRMARLAAAIGSPSARPLRREVLSRAVRLAWWMGWRACAGCAVLAAASWRMG